MTAKLIEALIAFIFIITVFSVVSYILGAGMIAIGIFLVSIGWMYTGAFLSIAGVLLIVFVLLLEQKL